jgi:arabinogalactan endo-1,4-beta-galactosidase
MQNGLFGRPMRRGLAVTVAAAAIVTAATALSPSGSIKTGSALASGQPQPGLALNLALTGSATASTSAAGSPAGNAIDASGSTSWCSTQWTGTLTVDLGHVRRLSGFGFTLGSMDTSASVSLSYATEAGVWHRPASAQQMSVTAGEPVYLPASGSGVDARYAQLSVTDNDGTPPCVGELRLFAAAPDSAIPYRGADLSFEPQEEATGASFTDNGVPGSPLQILDDHGLNYVRLRLWVNPPAGYSNLASDLKMAQRVKQAGDRLYLDIHYSDFWADPQHQDIPAAWQGQDLNQLTDTVRNYTQHVIGAFAAQGTPVDMVSIGNEIRNGMLWPIGRIDWGTGSGWDNLGMLLRAGVQGAQAANPAGHKLLVMIHFDQGGDNAQSRAFYDHILAQHVRFDVIGLSYYSFFHGPLASMRANVDDLATRYGKPIVIAESQYAWTLAGGDSTGNFVWQASQVEPGYPATPGGQLSFYNDLLSILAQVPDHRGIGLFYWEPEWIPSVGWEPGAGTPNDNLTLFSFTGAALPSVGLFQSPLAVCAAYDPMALPCQVPDGASAAAGGGIGG